MAMDVAADLERGRDAAARSAWAEAHAALSRAAHVEALGAGDLELLATVAAMLGRDDERVAWLERAYHAHTDAGAAAARCAFWLGLTLLLRGEPARAGGWFGRGAAAGRARHDRDCVERGYLLLPVVIERQAAGERRGGGGGRRRRRARSPSASATPTCSRSRCTSRGTRWPCWGASTTGCGCSTRRWSRCAPASSRRS